VFSAATLAVLAAVGWIAPTILVLTELRDRPLTAAFAGIDGRLASRSASWTWFGGIEYRDVVLLDREGRPVIVIKRLVSDRGLAALAIDPGNLGTIRLIGGEGLVEVRRGGSNLEDILAPWLATWSQPASLPFSCELELVDGAIELVDLARQDAWRITELVAATTIRDAALASGWAVSGRVVHAGEPVRDLMAAITRPASAPAAGSASNRLDRATIAAAATAALARDGGWSVSSPESPAADAPRTVAIAGSRVPLGISSVWATRFDSRHLVDGLADIRLDVAIVPPTPAADPRRQEGQGSLQIAGSVTARTFTLCDSESLVELLAVDRCELPLDVSTDGRTLLIRTLKASSPLFQAEASGRIGLPRDGSWQWAESLIDDDFAVAADIDLTAAARAIPGGLQVRPDVRITTGQIQIAAAAHADGSDRVLELRATSRDIAAVQGERQLRWNEPFTAWLRGRRGAAAGERLRIEEARIASPAVEMSAAGTAESSTLQWTIDLDALVPALADVLDLRGHSVAGICRGSGEIKAAATAGLSTGRLATSLSNFEWSAPGRPAWRDDEIMLELDGTGSLAAGAAVVDAAHGVVVAGNDRLEMTLTGGAIVNPLATFGGAADPLAAPWVRAAADSEGISADWSLAGDIGRWQPRLMALLGDFGVGERLQFGGRVQASATLASRATAWQIRRAGAEIEKLTAAADGWKVAEPRVVASAAGMFDPASDRIEISSAEILSATVSLRTGGLVLQRPPAGRREAARPDPLFPLLDGLRGRAQWQADVGRLEKWVVAPATTARFAANGRAWGTLEIIDTPAGMNLLVDATGNQLTLAEKTGADQATPTREIWAEPRARAVVEVTRPAAAVQSAADRMMVNRLSLESSTVAVAAAGNVDGWSTRPLVDIGGTLTYDWSMLSRLLSPWTGGRLRLAGADARPFSVRAPLDSILTAVVGDRGLATRIVRRDGPQPPPKTETVPLPDDWLSAIRSRDGDESERPVRMTLPVARPGSRSATAGQWLRNLAIDTSAAWTAADIDGFQVEAGETPVRLFEGQLAFGPFEIAASGGRLRGAPWIRLLPAPGELVVPPGRVVDRVTLSNRLCEQWIAWVAPLIGRSTRTQGLMSVDLSAARLPLADPFSGEMDGQLIFESLEVAPGPMLQPFANLLVKLQSLIDPRFAFGDKAVLMRVRSDPVRIRLADRRLWHEGLVMDMGQLVIRSGGSVGSDGSLAMAAEVAFRGDLAGTTPVIGQLMRTPLLIPLRGTVHRPQFDGSAIDKILGRMVENTAEAIIGDGLSRGLEELFGNPQPPAGATP
jgi:hypothetical protein